VAGSCEHGNKHLGSIKSREFLDCKPEKMKKKKKKIVKEKERTERKTYKNVHICILLTQTRAVTCYKTDP
jgi:hypothetical protein